MARQPTILSMGKKLDSNLLKSGAGSLDEYYLTEQERLDIAFGINEAQVDANTAQTTANNAAAAAAAAQATANSANAAAATAQATANTAAGDADIAVGMLAGANNFYKGTTTTSINGTPSNLVLNAFTSVTSENISQTGGIFNFGHLGDYLLSVKLGGTMTNSRNDWYQSVYVDAHNVTTGEIITVYEKTIPPLYTIGIQGVVPTILVKVVSGDQWRIRVSCVASGVISSGTAVVQWSKVV